MLSLPRLSHTTWAIFRLMRSLILVALLALVACETPLIDLTQDGQSPTPVPTTSPSIGPQIRVSITDKGFVPSRVTIRPGVSITWANVSQKSESVSLSQGAEFFDSGPIGPGQTFFYLFTKPGLYEYSSRESSVTFTGTVVVEDFTQP